VVSWDFRRHLDVNSGGDRDQHEPPHPPPSSSVTVTVLSRRARTCSDSESAAAARLVIRATMIRALAHEQYSPPSHDAIAAFHFAQRLRDVLGLATGVLGELLL